MRQAAPDLMTALSELSRRRGRPHSVEFSSESHTTRQGTIEEREVVHVTEWDASDDVWVLLGPPRRSQRELALLVDAWLFGWSLADRAGRDAKVEA